MPDREKVIKGLERCLISDCTCHCPYATTPACSEKLMTDALTLLKEQEPLPPDIGQLITGIYAICADCGHTLTLIADARGPQVEYHPKFCPECGRKVKWE